MPDPTYRITTLGCRVNHAESREIETVLRTRGLAPATRGAAADLEIVHTCSVTHAAAAKSRQAIRRAGRRRAGKQDGISHSLAPTVIVTGCFTGTDPVDAERLAGRQGTIVTHEHDGGDAMIERFAAHVDRWLARRRPPLGSIRSGPDASSTAGRRTVTPGRRDARPGIVPIPLIAPTPRAGAHVRAEVRIQDGCDAHCTFCIIPKIRRTLRSKRVADVVAEVRRLVEIGHREIVLTGVFIGAYGHETALRRRQKAAGGRDPIADLIDAVAQVDGLERLRLSSMEPGDATEAVLDAMAANAGVVVPHLHLPLQSGSDRVLRMMNRQYDVPQYLDMVDRVNATLTTPDGMPPAITTDVICGFPGEDEEDFDRTIQVARRVGYLHMHVFPFSPRHGTAAARWRDRHLDPSVIRQRVRRLIDLEEQPDDGLSIRFRRRLLGRTVRVILEQPVRDEPGMMTGRCDHYAQVGVRTAEPRGTLLEGRVTHVAPDRIVAEPVAPIVRLPLLATASG